METFYEVLAEYQEIYDYFYEQEDLDRIDMSIWAIISQMGLIGRVQRVAI